MSQKRIILIITLILFQSVQLSMADHPHGITADNLLGTEVSMDGNVYHISKGTAEGNNLFHSFEKFNLHQKESAIFNDSGYDNTISRVTGSDYSWINGKITSMAENFYLLNPNGIMFGSRVSLDVAGSFHVSTCDFLEFSPDEKFYTSSLETSFLTASSPASFGFLDNDVGPISMDTSVLMVPDQKTISLIGGKIDSSYGYIYAPSGQINIAGVNSPGLVMIAPDSLSVSSEIKGDISLTGSYVEVSGDNPGRVFVQANELMASEFTFFLAENTGAQGTGVLSVIANNISIEDSGFYATTYGEGNAGKISLYALEDITISSNQSGLDVSAQIHSTGQSGDILISANNLHIDKAFIKNRTENNTGGQVTIETTGDITINNGLFELRTGDFDGSSLSISGNNIFINDGNYLLGTASAGSAGKLEIKAANSIHLSGSTLIDSNTDATLSSEADEPDGNAGDISLIAGKDLILNDNVKISSSVYHMSHGNGGKILLQAGESLTLQGNDYENRVQIVVNNYDKYNAYYLPGNAGVLEMRAKNISLLDYVRIDASTSYLNYDHIISNPSYDGSPDHPEHYPNDNKGKGGFVYMIAEESITLKGNGDLRLIPIEIVPNRNFVWEKKVEYPVHIDMSSYGTGHAGELKMDAKNISIYDDVKIDGYSGFIGDGPTIRFNASENLLLHGTKEPVYFESIINNHSFDIWAFPIDIDLKSVWRGKSRTIHMDAKNVLLKDYVSININTYAVATSKAGGIYINAHEDFRFEGISTDDYISNINISCLYPDVDNQTVIQTSSSSGTISLDANNIHFSNVEIKSQIGDPVSFEYGLAGEIKFHANKLIKLENTKIKNYIRARYREVIFSEYDNSISLIADEIVLENCSMKGSSHGRSPAGDINIIARKKISIFDSEIMSSLFPLQGYITVVDETVAGEILIKTPVFELYDSKIFAQTEAQGNGGNIVISGYHDIELSEETNAINQSCNMVKLSNSLINSQSSRYFLWDLTGNDGDAGNIVIATKELILEESKMESVSNSKGKGGLVGIGKVLSFDKESKSVTIIEPADYVSLNNSYITTAGWKNFSDEAGNIKLGSKNTELRDQSYIISTTGGENDAGEINIHGSNLVLSTSFITTSSTTGKGNAGNINLHIETLNLEGNSEIVSSSNAEINGGRAGNIHIGSQILDHGDDHFEIIKPANEVTLVDNSRISTDALSAPAGKIKIIAKDNLYLLNSRITTNVTDSDVLIGETGNIELEANSIKIDGHSFVSSQTFGNARAGEVNLYASDLLLSKTSSVTTSSKGTGDAGNINLNLDTLYIEGRSEIVSDSNAEKDGGTAGTIHIGGEIVHYEDEDRFEIIEPCNKITLVENSRIATDALSSGGGKVKIKSKDTLYLLNSTISTNVKDGTGKGGDINIDTSMALLNHSQISANAVEGDGGAVFIVAEHFIKSTDSRIEATSQRGNEGTVKIDAPDIDISSALTTMASDFLDASQWMRNSCKKRSSENISRLIVRGKDAVPGKPDDLHTSPAIVFKDLHLEQPNIKQEITKAEVCYQKGDFASAAIIWFDAEKRLNKHAKDYLTIVTYLIQSLQSIGFHHKALTMGKKALSVAEKTKPSPERILFYNSFGDLLLSLNELSDAIRYLKIALKDAKESKNKAIMASVMNNVANAVIVDGDINTGIQIYDNALIFLSKSDKPALKAKIYLNLAYVISIIGTYEESITAYNDALSMIQSLPDNHDKAFDLNSLSKTGMLIDTYFPEKKSPSKTSYGLLASAQAIGEKINDKRVISMASGNAAKILENSGQYKKALEKIRYAIFTAEQTDNKEIAYKWHWQAGRLFKKLGNESQAIVSYEKAISLLSDIREELFCGIRLKMDIFEVDVKPVYLGLAEIYLDQADRESQPQKKEQKILLARAVMERLKNAELADYFEDECVAGKQKNKANALRRTPDGVALIYPIALPERLTILITLPDAIKHYNVDISYKDLNKLVRSYRKYLQVRSSNQFLGVSQKIYQLLIHPVEKDLIAANIHTLLVAPDGVLRLVPFSSLHDNEKFVVEKYAIVTIPSISLTDTSSSYQKETPETLVVGLSDALQDFSALPSINAELRDIKKIMNGKKMYKNADYTVANVQNEFKTNDYNIVHFATHGVFGGTGKNSFLLTYDSQLNMNALEDLMSLGKYRNHQVDLLTLSACQTALGNERAALGLAGVAVKAGVRSAVATLWYVDDEATSLAIREFYRQLRKNGMSKAKALQNAQKMLLSQRKFWHPLYWAPFLLIGNWT